MQVTERVHALRIPFQITGPDGKAIERFVYSYLICAERLCLIDCGVAGRESIILRHLKEIKRSPDEISALVLTHSHPDHMGSAAAIKEISGCAVYAHASERTWIEDVARQERERPVPGFRSLVAGSVRVDGTLADGDVLRLSGSGSSALRVLHTPGHSAGSISLWLEGDRALFTGDAIPVPGDMPIYQDIFESIRSIERLAQLRDVGVLLSAWDQPRMAWEAGLAFAEGRRYLERIHEAVLRAFEEMKEDGKIEKMIEKEIEMKDGKESVGGAAPDWMRLCRRVLELLALPAAMANPLVALSFQSSIRGLQGQE